MATASTVVVFVLFRLIFPLALFGATIVRFNGFSFIYGCLMLAAPLLPRPSPVTMKGHTRRFLIACITLCSLMLLAQICFQAYLLAVSSSDHPYGTVLGNCSAKESTLRQLGLQRLEPNDFGNILRIIIPDIGMFIISLLVFLLCRKLCPPPSPSFDIVQAAEVSVVRTRIYQRTTSFINFMGEFMVALFLAASGIASPSVLSAVYFLVFLSVATWWACYNRLGSKFAVVRLVLLVYCGIHLILEYLYQFHFFQEALPPDSLIARILGLNAIVMTDCRKPWLLQFNPNAKWYMYASPGVILLLYYTLACETRRWMRDPDEVPHQNPYKSVSSKSKRYVRDAESGEDQVVSGDDLDITEKFGIPDSFDDILNRVDNALNWFVQQFKTPTIIIPTPKHYSSMALVSGSAEVQNYQTLNDTDTSSLAPAGYGDSSPEDESAERVEASEPSIQDPANGTNKESNILGKGQRSPIVSVFVYIMKQSYICTLIVMMAWSITYHSWLTFVYLLAACIIWMIPQKRRVSLVCSPVIVLYAEVLLAIQYVFGLNLTDKELPIMDSGSGYKYKEIGLVKYEYPCIPLAIQIAFTVAFWLTLRQYMRERYIKKQEFFMQGLNLDVVKTESRGGQVKRQLRAEDLVDGYDGDSIKALGLWVWHMCCKYWIFVCAVMFLVMAVQDAVIYRIVYMVLFLYFVITFQIVYSWWRLSVYVFWWIVIIYSMVLLCLIYTYQFDQIEHYWKNSTGISQEMLSSIGLEHFSTGTLFAELLTPTSFLIVIILQVHYFQRPFNSLSDIYRYVYGETQAGAVEYHDDDDHSDGLAHSQHEPEAAQIEHDVTQETIATNASEGKKTTWNERAAASFKKCYKLAENFLNKISDLIWRLLEIHIFKVVAFTIFFVCLEEVCASNVLFVFFLMMGVPVVPLRNLMSHLCQIWSALIILAKMIYQLELLPEDKALSNCTSVINVPVNHSLPPPFNDTVNNAHYVGLEKNSDLASYLQNYIIITVLLAFEAIIKIHQEQHYKPPARQKPMNGIVFEEVKREDADLGMLQCLKFIINYAFYKFGLEICFIMTMVTMVVRLDAYSVVYGIFLGILLLLPRKKCYYVWPIYITILVIILTLQYLSCLGVPAGLCWDYPWDYIKDVTANLKIYLYLPDFQDPPDPLKLIADFFQLLFVCLQMRVFYLENSDQADRFGGGPNDVTEPHHVSPRLAKGPKDFLSCKDSYLDYIKTGVFLYMYWVTLIIVFIAGTTRISLFCMGYLVGCFFFLWFGQELLVKPLKNLLRLWGVLLGYNFFVILSKACLQLVGCVYLSHFSTHLCWVVQLFSIVCLRSGNYQQAAAAGNGTITDSSEVDIEGEINNSVCNLDEDAAGLTWDAICFVFLLLQLRIYKSHYFRHVVVELEIQNKLSARGAELINTNLIRRVEVQRVKEAEILETIKTKMERIKQNQAKLFKASAEADDHYVVIRSGDYYMFDEDTDKEDTESIEPLDMADSLQYSSDDDDKGKIDPLKLMNTAFKKGTKEALHVAERQQDRKSKVSESSDISSRPESARLSSSDLDTPSVTPSTPLSPDDSDGASKKPELEAISEESQEKSDAASPKKTGEQDGEGGRELVFTGDKEEDEQKEEEEEEKESLGTRIVNGLRLAWAVFGSFLDTLIGILHDISREYRSVSRILDREKAAEKEKIRKSAQTQVDEPGTSSEESSDGTEVKVHRRQKTPTEIVLQIDDMDRNNFDKSVDALREAEKDFQSEMPRILQLCIALLEALMSRSEVVCYFAMILNHMVSASLLSLAYPLSVFLWAMLSVPRPTKTYWVTIITYTEAIVVVKYLFQFGFFPWNDGVIQTHPFFPPRIIGIEKKSNYAVFDLILLICLFLHRTVLKRHGLWKDAQDLDEDMANAEKVISRPSSPAHEQVTTQEGLFAITEAGESQLTDGSQPADNKEVVESEKKKKKQAKAMSYCAACFKPFSDFYKQMTNPDYNAVTDVYAKMFFCDFIAFIIIVFGYTSFGPAETTGAETVTSVIQDNKVPVPFLVMLLAQFVLIIIDRALFLRKNVFGKFLFQIFLVALVHVWMFFVLPAVTQRKFSDNTAAQLWYFVKCIYFGLSAIQIRSGYPTRILGNFLTKKYNYVNLFCFKGFLVLPFLLELRCLMDWMWTDTTLALTSWLQMEDIYANIFMLKCWRRAEKAYPTPSGVKRKAVIKYGVGGLLLFLLIFIIWFPLLLFSLANTVYVSNPPDDCTLDVRLGGFQPLFRMSAQQSNLHYISQYNYTKFRDYYGKDPYVTSFLNSYEAEDIYLATIPGNSTSVWGISPPSQDELITSLLGNDSISMVVTVTFSREPKTGVASESVTGQFITKLTIDNASDKETRQKFADMVSNPNGSNPITILNLFPSFLRVPASGKLEQVHHFNRSQANVTFQINKDEAQSKQWWELRGIAPEDALDAQSSLTLKDYITIVAFNDRVAPGAFSFFTSYGIIGLYLSFILVIGRFIRLMTSGLAANIMFTHLPCVDRMMKICKDLYLVREAGELRLEEELFAKLVFLYRSPETLIQETRISKEKQD